MIDEQTFVKVFDELVKIKISLEEDPDNYGLNRRYYQLLYMIFGKELIGVHSGNRYRVVDVDPHKKLLRVLKEDGELTQVYLSSVNFPVSKSRMRREMLMLSYVYFSGLAVKDYPEQGIKAGSRVVGYLYIDKEKRYYLLKNIEVKPDKELGKCSIQGMIEVYPDTLRIEIRGG